MITGYCETASFRHWCFAAFRFRSLLEVSNWVSMGFVMLHITQRNFSSCMWKFFVYTEVDVFLSSHVDLRGSKSIREMLKGPLITKSKTHIFILTFSAIYLWRSFWCELPHFEDVGHSDVGLALNMATWHLACIVKTCFKYIEKLKSYVSFKRVVYFRNESLSSIPHSRKKRESSHGRAARARRM